MGRFFAGLLAIALLAACNERALPADSTASSGPGPATMVTTQSAEVCLTDGSFDFHVYGEGMAAWEGKRIAASAIEPHEDFSDPHHVVQTLRRPLQALATQISGGAYSIMCPSSLLPDSGYPSYAVFIDVDGDGKCGGADLGLQMQLYAWNAPIDDHIGVSVEGVSFMPVAQMPGAIGDGVQANRFCQDYFP
jgi:hypothetical protein